MENFIQNAEQVIETTAQSIETEASEAAQTVVDAVHEVVEIIDIKLESLVDKVKRSFHSNDKAHLSDALISMASAVEDIKTRLSQVEEFIK